MKSTFKFRMQLYLQAMLLPHQIIDLTSNQNSDYDILFNHYDSKKIENCILFNKKTDLIQDFSIYNIKPLSGFNRG